MIDKRGWVNPTSIVRPLLNRQGVQDKQTMLKLLTIATQAKLQKILDTLN